MLPLSKSETSSVTIKRIKNGSKWAAIGSMMSRVRIRPMRATKMTERHSNTYLIRLSFLMASSRPWLTSFLKQATPSTKTSKSSSWRSPCATMLQPRSHSRPSSNRAAPTIRTTRVCTRRRNRSCSSPKRTATNSRSGTTAC